MIKIIKIAFLFVFILICSKSYSYNLAFRLLPDDTIKISSSDFQANLDSLLNNFFVSQSLKINTNNLFFNNNDTSDEIIPQFSDSVYIQRLQNLPSIIDMTYNDKVRAFIELYVNKKRKNVKVMLGLAQYYFPIFEEILDKHGLPHELKYLTIIESALNPRAVSKMGASGIWQFMYTTGKLYDLQVNSLVDERRDPVKASYAAANYLKDLYNIYKDWTLAIAAYNCGPGNVNKAIKRAKGKTNFWEIYDYLPSETRGYVPAFIAANYMMNYYKEHNLFPQKIDFPVLTDTVMVDADINLKDVSELLNVPLQQLRDLNPQYKNDIIPGSSEVYAIKLPINLVTTFIELEDSIAVRSKESLLKNTDMNIVKNSIQVSPNDDVIRINYKVKPGDTYQKIARKFNVDEYALKEWNRMRGKKLKTGQNLIIYTVNKNNSNQKPFVQKTSGTPITTDSSSIKKANHEENKSTIQEHKKINNEKKSTTTIHVVKKGESLTSIAKKYNVSVNEIMNWNDIKTHNHIVVGQKIKILNK